MQNEDKAFGWRQRVEHNEQRDADRVCKQRFAFGIGALSMCHARLDDLCADRLFAP